MAEVAKASLRPGQGTITFDLWLSQCLLNWTGKQSVESNEGKETAGGALTQPRPLAGWVGGSASAKFHFQRYLHFNLESLLLYLGYGWKY